MHKKDIVFFTLGPIAASLLSVVTIPILAWNFSVADMGRLSLMQMLVSFSILFFSFGLDEAYLREFHEVKNKSRLLKTVLSPGLIVLFTVSVLIFVFGLTNLSELLFELDNSSLALLVIIGVVIAFILRFLTLIFRIKEESEKYALIGVIPKFIQVVFVILCVYIYDEVGFGILILSYVLPNFFTLIIAIFLTRKDLVNAAKTQLQYSELKTYLSYGFPLVFAGIGSWALISLDKLFLRGMSTMEELGIYSVAASIAAIVGVLTGIVNTILAPVIYKMSADGTYTKKNQNLLSERVLASVLLIFVCGGLFNWIVPKILPSAYANIDNFIICCIASPLLYTLSEVSSIGINLVRRTGFVFIAVFCALVINSVGNYFLIPHYGASGAAIATALGFYCYFFVKVLAANFLGGKVPTTKLLGLPIICLLLMVSEAFLDLDEPMIFRLFMAFDGLYISYSFQGTFT